MSRNSSGRSAEGFLTGKGFYIVLFLCAAVIGVSALMIARGNETMNSSSAIEQVEIQPGRVETIIVPAASEDVEVLEPDTDNSGLNETTPVSGGESIIPVEAAAPVYVWPVMGEISRSCSINSLAYDTTLRDWRTHCGIDISSELGTVVTAIRSGTVESIEKDDMLGTVVTIDHGNGMKSIYANLEEATAVSVGSWVDCSTVLGTVGRTALSEIGQPDHLHLAVTLNGSYVDPMNYLPI